MGVVVSSFSRLLKVLLLFAFSFSRLLRVLLFFFLKRNHEKASRKRKKQLPTPYVSKSPPFMRGPSVLFRKKDVEVAKSLLVFSARIETTMCCLDMGH